MSIGDDDVNIQQYQGEQDQQNHPNQNAFWPWKNRRDLLESLVTLENTSIVYYGLLVTTHPENILILIQ